MIIPLPEGLQCEVFAFSQRTYSMDEMSDSNGDTATRIMSPPRWGLRIAAPSNGVSLAQAALWEAMVLQLRGSVNHLEAYDIVRQAPRGSFRSNFATLAADAAAHDTSIVIAGAMSGGPDMDNILLDDAQVLLDAKFMGLSSIEQTNTLSRGDWLQIGNGLGGQLVKATEDAMAVLGGTITVEFEAPLRNDYAAGTPVRLNRALGYYKAVSPVSSWSYRAGWNTLMGYELELLEQWG